MNTHNTLEELEGQQWPEPGKDASRLIITCHSLRKKELGQFTIEDLRIMIGQQIGLAHLLPLAITVLQEDPFAEGDHYEGDLLLAVLKCPYEVLKLYPKLAGIVTAVKLSIHDHDLTASIVNNLKNSIEAYERYAKNN